jgi:hypothetical protein
MRLVDVLRQISPPFLWQLASRVRHGNHRRMSYQGVTTLTNMSLLHEGRFAQVYDAAYPIDPGIGPDGNMMRLRVHLSVLFAEMALRVPGDFVSIGISYGVTEKVVYELVVKGTQRTYHLIDPFVGDPHENCVDPSVVVARFSGDPHVRLHLTPAPQVFPLVLDNGLAFAELSTANQEAELASLPYLIASLNPGGVIVIDDYGWDQKAAGYDRVVHAAGASIFCLPTGQGVLMKAGN